MSGRYWHSPTLVLTCSDTPWGRLLWLGYCALVMLALYQLLLRGHGLVAGGLLLPALLCLGLIRRASPDGRRRLICGAQYWWLQGPGPGAPRAVVLQPGSICLPWLLCIALRDLETGSRRRLWLWSSGCEASAWRGLRRRLTVQG